MPKNKRLWSRISSKQRRRSLQFESLENRRVLAAYISELHYDPLFGDSEQHQYVEFRGSPGTQLDEGTYFVGIESADGVDDLGDVHTVIDLGGLFIGSNGYLVLLQEVKDPGGIGGPPPGYAVHAGANVLQGQIGFQGLPGNIFEADDGAIDIHGGTSTYFLLQSDVKPELTDDIDSNDDGTPDGVYNDWTILDGFSVVPQVETPFDQHAFGPIVFSERGAGDGFLPDATIVRTVDQAYVARIAGSIGYEARDWVTGNTVEVAGAPFEFQLQHGTFGTPRPEFYGGRILDHVGGPNWFGSFSGNVFNDLNRNGVQDDGEDFVDGIQVQVEPRVSEATFWEILEPNDFAEGDDISNTSPFLTTITAGSDNVPDGFRNIVVQEPNQLVGEHVFSHSEVDFFSNERRLRVDFFHPVRTVEIDVIGNAVSDPVYGRLEAFNVNGDSMGFVRSAGLRDGFRQTLSVSSPNDDIAWVVAYSDENFRSSSPFGRLDSLKVEIPYTNTSFITNGQFAVTPLVDATYDVSIGNSGEFAQTFPDNLESITVGIIERRHVNDVNFGFKPKEAALLEDQSYSTGELIEAGGVIAVLPVVLGYLGQPLEFEILSGDDENQFEIDNETYELKSRNGDFDFETNPDFTLVVELTDPSLRRLTDQATIQVTFTDQNDPPIVQEQQGSVAENSSADTELGTMAATDQDSSVFTWSITGGNTGDAFKIDPATGVVSIADPTPVNFEANPIFDLVVRATDDGEPENFGEEIFRVHLTDVDEIPIVADKDLSIAENSPAFAPVGRLEPFEPDAGESITWRIVGTDAQFFDLVPLTGELRVAEGADFDFETKSEYVFLAEATDSAVPPKTGSRSITVNVTDNNDAPVISDASPSLAENSPADTEVATIVATDQDPGQTLSYEITGGLDAASFNIDATTGVLTVAADATLDFESDATLEVEVQATDDHSPPASSSLTITVQLEDVNDPPSFDDGATFIDENSPAGATATPRVLDQDTGDTHTFEILSQSENWFELNTDGSALQVLDGAVIDFETQSTNIMELRVTDAAGASATGTVTISAVDINDAPEVANPIPDMQVDVDAEFSYTVPLATFSDQDVGDSLIYSATNGAGFSLPDWISFDRSSRTFTGTPTASEVGILEIRVNAVDTSNAIAFDVFELTIGSGSTWHNADRPTDVSGDSSTSAIDALIMIDFLNTIGAFRIPPNEASEFGFVDVNNDGSVSAIDALIVIDELNTRGAAEGEFDRSAFFQPSIDLGAEEDEDEELIRLLALDTLQGV